MPVATLWLLGCLNLVVAQPGFVPQGLQARLAFHNPRFTLPSGTDAAINSFNSPHLSWLPKSSPRNQLLVFLPGTYGVPHDFPFADIGAALGYHVIFLMYPDTVAAQQACSRSPDPDAYINFRLEIIRADNVSPLIHIDRANSIENRLFKLLLYLNKHQPNQGWEQYLDLSAGAINWQKIVISGMSQGGGHAYVISKYHEVARVIMFGSPKDYSLYFHQPAHGFDGYTKTPLNRYFAFNHVEDIEGCNYQQQMEIFEQMGLTKFGIAIVDNLKTSYNNAHLLFTDIQLPDASDPRSIHASVISPKNQQIFTPVWQYLLSD